MVPESLLNSADNAATRLFLYRTFWIRAIVSLPRNLFIETPTLTSLLFAQKKTKEEIAAWDKESAKAHLALDNLRKETMTFLRKTKGRKDVAPSFVQDEVLSKLSTIITPDTVITKKGMAPVPVRLPKDIATVADACKYYDGLFKLGGFRLVLRNAIFEQICAKLDHEFNVYMVSEVGYKLSKRKERVRPNHLCKIVGDTSAQEMPNLHLASEPVSVVVDTNAPERVLDFIRRDVKWA